MTNLLLKDDLINENGGRVVVVSSMGHYGGKINYDDLNWTKNYGRWTAYFQSKLANVLFARELNKRMQSQGKNITAVSLHPGAGQSRLATLFSPSTNSPCSAYGFGPKFPGACQIGRECVPQTVLQECFRRCTDFSVLRTSSTHRRWCVLL